MPDVGIQDLEALKGIGRFYNKKEILYNKLPKQIFREDGWEKNIRRAR